MATTAEPPAQQTETVALSDASERSPGLSDRLAGAVEVLAALSAELDPDRLCGPDAVLLYGALARAERLVGAAKTLLAPRIATSGTWRTEGHRTCAGFLAAIEGGTAGQARRTLETGARLVGLPAVTDALRQGRLSGAQATEIAHAAALDPDREGALVPRDAGEDLAATKERCRRSVATSARRDPMAAIRRIHRARSFRSWIDTEGAFCFQGRDTPERGAALLARLTPLAESLAGSPSDDIGGSDDSRVPYDALMADAFFALVTTGAGPLPAGGDHLVDRPAPATVVVRVDLAALRRGHARGDERCEIDGQGPVPVPLARSLCSDAFLALVFEEAGDIKAVSHQGRTVHRAVRTALVHRDRTCVVPGCHVAYGLEIDHLDPYALGGPTSLDNLALLCHHHHRLKTYEGWELARSGPSDADPGWTFTPQAPFGQEPGLGIDRPPDPVPRR